MSYKADIKFLVKKVKGQDLLMVSGFMSLPQHMDADEKGEMWIGTVDIPFQTIRLANLGKNVRPEEFINDREVRKAENWGDGEPLVPKVNPKR